MTTGSYTRRKWRSTRVGQGLFETFVFAVIGAFLSTDTTHFTAVAGGIPTDGHAGCPAFTGAEQRDLGAERVLVTIVGGPQMLDSTGHAQAGNLGKTTRRDTQIIGIRVRGIKLRGQT